ncbi:hypothetical protein ACTPEM_25975, partial [Clostridioides difficile]
NDVNRNLENLSLHLDVLLKKCPGKSADLLLKSEYVTELRNKAIIYFHWFLTVQISLYSS